MGRIKYDFSGERFAVTGASSGIGRRVALDLAASGAIVLGIGRNTERLESLRKNFPERIFTASLDVCDYSALEEAIASFTQSHGKLNGGVHAAGIDFLTPLRSTTYERGGGQIMNTSFWAGIDFLQIVTKSNYSEPGTSTVLFSSVSALSHDKGKFVYASAKTAVNAAVRSAAKEISGKNHRVNSILPGWTDTPMTQELSLTNDMNEVRSRLPLGIGRPEDVSNAVMFLLSDDSRWITGTNFVVDGGYSS